MSMRPRIEHLRFLCENRCGFIVLHLISEPLSTISSWRNNWAELSTYFKYPPELRRLIYTTNSIENFNRQLRKVTKSKTIFPTDDALFKMLYLAMNDITEKWIARPRDWTRILEQLIIYFDGRISLLDID